MTPPEIPVTVTVTLELTDRKAYALAQFVKRLSWSGMAACASSEEETYDIRDGIDLLQRALADAGYAPR